MSGKKEDGSYFLLREVWKGFGLRKVLRGVSLAVPEGQTTVILGGSGEGKSVLLKVLNGLVPPDSGSVEVEGCEIASLPERKLDSIRRRIGMLFQEGALFDSITVGENVAFPLREIGGRKEKDIQNEVTEALEKVGLSGEEQKMPGDLSGGMRKRVALARAMVTRPSCLLCDEPTAGLDPVLSEKVVRLIRETAMDRKLTAVVVTHDLGAMRLLANRVAFLSEGVVRFSGTPEELEKSDDPTIVEFLRSAVRGG